MQGMGTTPNPTGNEFVLFTTSRPSRTDVVTASEHDLAQRREREVAWAAQIGMDWGLPGSPEFTRTGSPTGTRAPHQADDFVEDASF